MKYAEQILAELNKKLKTEVKWKKENKFILNLKQRI